MPNLTIALLTAPGVAAYGAFYLLFSRYQWKKVDIPGLVTLDAMFAFTVVSGGLEHVTLEADPRLRMLSPRDNLPIERYDIQSGARKEITLKLDRTYRSGETVTLPPQP